MVTFLQCMQTRKYQLKTNLFSFVFFLFKFDLFFLNSRTLAERVLGWKATKTLEEMCKLLDLRSQSKQKYDNNKFQ